MGSRSPLVIGPQDFSVRIVTALTVILIATPVSALGPACAYLAFVLSAVAFSRTKMPWRRLMHVEGFLLLLFVTLPFTVPGTTLFELGPLVATNEGLERALVLATKVAGSVLLLMLFFADAEPVQISVALRWLGIPETLVRIFLGVVRYLGLIRQEFARLQDAMRLRSFRPKSNRHTWRSYGYLVGMLLLRAMERADRVEEAMRLRGYAGRFPSTAQAAPTLRDWIVGTAFVSFTLLVLIWDTL
ncbi:MAG: cobalt ECF transporter T component CbiQ [Mesorhizobium sp.]|nr:cobalt ECF transporter T component CbiQ [Mesorhizobium sp.]MBL8579896.1 cobalt ECF transporter T component CbiQ [Mesorhizobium sp.]